MPEGIYETNNAAHIGQKILYNYNKMQSAFSQILAVLIGNIIMLQFGMAVAMSTVVNGELMSIEKRSDQKFTLNPDQASWYGSLVLICLPVGGLLSSAIQDKYGRKTCFTLVSIPEFFGWLFLYLANSSTLLYLSSIFLGISMGLSEAPILTYIGESVEPRLRSSLSSFTVFCSMIGLSLTFNLTTFFPWRQIALIYLCLPVAVFFMTALIIPESPMWLLSKNKIQEATKSLCWLRGFTDANAVRPELNYMLQFSQHKNGNEENRFFSTVIKEKLGIFKDKYILRTFIMFCIIFVICNISAMFPAKPFLRNIMDRIGLPLDSKFALAVVGTGTLCGTFMNMFTIKFVGKKKLLIISIFISSCCQLTLALYAMGAFNSFIGNSWLPFILFCCISFATGYGIAPIPWILLGELFPMKSRGILSGIASAVSSISAFFLMKTYWDVVTLCSLPWALMIHAIFGLAGIPYIYCKLPETENKTLQQIQHHLETH